MRLFANAGALLLLCGLAWAQPAANLTWIRATVERDKRFLGNLPQSAFEVREDGKPQTIEAFERDSRPASIGLLVDDSGSMRDFASETRQLVEAFLSGCGPRDELFLVKFNNSPYLLQDFTSDLALIRTGLDKGNLYGPSALLDALQAAEEHMLDQASNGNQTLVIFTDGLDNESMTKRKDLVESLPGTGIAVYAIALQSNDRRLDSVNRTGRDLLNRLTRPTGGVAYDSRRVEDLKPQALLAAEAIHTQYVLGYASPQANTKERKVSVKVATKGTTVRARPGQRDSNVSIR